MGDAGDEERRRRIGDWEGLGWLASAPDPLEMGACGLLCIGDADRTCGIAGRPILAIDGPDEHRAVRQLVQKAHAPPCLPGPACAVLLRKILSYTLYYQGITKLAFSLTLYSVTIKLQHMECERGII